MRKVMLQEPGAKSAGPYRFGDPVTIEDAEAARLVSVKGFVYVDEASAPAPVQEPLINQQNSGE